MLLVVIPIILAIVAFIIKKFSQKKQAKQDSTDSIELNDIENKNDDKTMACTPKASHRMTKSSSKDKFLEEKLEGNMKSKEEIKRKIKWFKIAHQTLLGEYAFMGFMASSYLIFTAFGINIRYGLKDMKSIAILSMICGAIFFISFIGYFVFFIRKKDHFGEFSK